LLLILEISFSIRSQVPAPQAQSPTRWVVAGS
jgi:hypothetical protein